MAAGDYTTVESVKEMLGGQIGPDGSLGPGTTGTRDGVLATIVTATSREFDRETGKTTAFWAPATAIDRRYSGSGNQFLDIDEFNALTAVTMSSKQDRSDAVTLTLTDATSMNFVVPQPKTGPPFNQLFLLRGWLPDAYDVQNIAVTGDLVTPAEIAMAVAIWSAYKWRSRESGWADLAGHIDGGSGQLYVRGIPPDVQRVIDYFKNQGGMPKAALVSGGNTDRLSPWLGWRTS